MVAFFTSVLHESTKFHQVPGYLLAVAWERCNGAKELACRVHLPQLLSAEVLLMQALLQFSNTHTHHQAQRSRSEQRSNHPHKPHKAALEPVSESLCWLSKPLPVLWWTLTERGSGGVLAELSFQLLFNRIYLISKVSLNHCTENFIMKEEK